MPKIKIESPAGTIGTRVWLDGQQVPNLTDVRVSCPVDDLVRVNLSVLASESLDLTAEDAKVDVIIKALPGFHIVATHQPDGRVIYGCAKLCPPIPGVKAGIQCGCGWSVESTAGDGESMLDAKMRADAAWGRHLEERETPMCRPWMSRPPADVDPQERL